MDARLAFADLVLGARCGGCGAPAHDLCGTCRLLLAPRPHLARDDVVPVVAAGDYDGRLREAVLAWKRRGHTRLTPVLATLLAASVCAHEPRGGVLLVPVPTTRRSRRRRGGDRVAELSAAAARVLRDVGVDAVVAPLLVLRRQPGDQVGLGAAARSANLLGAMSPRPHHRDTPTAGRDLLVVDDVVTTGSTLREAVRALASQGTPVSGAAVVAARGSGGSGQDDRTT